MALAWARAMGEADADDEHQGSFHGAVTWRAANSSSGAQLGWGTLAVLAAWLVLVPLFAFPMARLVAPNRLGRTVLHAQHHGAVLEKHAGAIRARLTGHPQARARFSTSCSRKSR
jgi:hypothetical protein